MNTKELFDKIIQYHTYKENLPDPLKEYEDAPDFVEQIDWELDQHFDDFEYVDMIDNLGWMKRGEYKYLITYNVTDNSSVLFYVPDDLTIRKMKIERIINR